MSQPKKIKKLTHEQTARLSVYRDKWTAIGLSTEPADRPRAERAIGMMYAAAGLVPPRLIVWCGSPLSQDLTRAIISVRASVGASVRDSVRASVYGQHEAHWLAFYEFFGSECSLQKQVAPLRGLMELAQSAGWALPHESICWVCERHSVLRRDDRGRLHSETGPALQYPDGWSIYAWHGVRVPDRVIESREKTTVQDILNEPNVEIRRVMRNLYGTDKFLLDAGATSISACPEHGARLLSMRLPDDPEDIRVAELTCPSTGRVYYERVPPTISDCREALSWRFRIGPSGYQPINET